MTCVVVVGNDAWLSGVIRKLTPASTFGDDFVGEAISIRVRDNGTSANDPPDQASFVEVVEFANDCLSQPDYELLDLNNGNVQIKE